MHGRPRKALKPEDAAVSAIKAEKLRSLQSQLLHNHHNKIYKNETPVKNVSSEFHVDDTTPLDEENVSKLSGVEQEQKVPVMDNSCTGQANASSVVDGFNQIKTAV